MFYKALVFLLLILTGCSRDIGLNYTVEENIIGDAAIESGFVYDQALDILILIDSSGSMSDEASILATTMPKIYDELVGPSFLDLNWRLGLKSTDSTEGILTNWVDWDDPNVEFKLASLPLGYPSYFRQGEEGLDAAITSMAWDVDFHREDADLLIIWISDERDQSAISVEQYNNLSGIFKVYPFEVSESSIVVTWLSDESNTRCDYASELGTGYIEPSEIIIDLCDTDDWVNTLDYAKEHVPTLNEVWPLTYIPTNPDKIDVYVNDAIWNNWIYQPNNNSVFMTVIPDSGSYVVISYPYLD
jgi:hypothetical protein